MKGIVETEARDAAQDGEMRSGRLGQIWRTHGRTFGRIEQLGECRWRVASIEDDDADCRSGGGQLESEEDGEVVRVWIVGNLMEPEEEEECSGSPGCRS